MSWLKTSIITIGLVSLSTPVLANSVTNSHTIMRKHGHGKTIVDVHRVIDRVETNFSQTVKIDAVGENAGTWLNFDGSEFTGGGFANNLENPDPFVMGGRGVTRQTLDVREVTKVNSTEYYDFNSVTNDYTLTVDF